MAAGFVGDLSQYICSGALFATSTGITTSSQLSGSSVDVSQDVANVLTATLIVGNVAGTTPTMNVKVQESTDGTTYTDVTSGAFVQVTTSNQIQSLAFKPTRRYISVTGTVSGTSPVFETTVIIQGPRRTVPTAQGGWNTTTASG